MADGIGAAADAAGAAMGGPGQEVEVTEGTVASTTMMTHQKVGGFTRPARE